MRLLEVRNVYKSFADKEILKGISLDIEYGEKVGLIGWNGAGKTTLIKILMKQLEIDSGSIHWGMEGVRFGYLPQSTEYLFQLEQEWQENNEELLHITKQLGLAKVQNWTEERLPQLSGGEKLKLSLAKIWASNPSCIFLDEPTNHLDLQGVNWLKEELLAYSSSAIIISHDRYFLDETVTKILELEHGVLKTYQGNYSDYQVQRREEQLKQQQDYEKQQRKIKRIEEQVTTLKKWSDKGHREAGKGGTPAENRQMGFKEYGRVQAKKKDKQIKSKLKRLEAELEKNKVDKPIEEQKVFFDFAASGKRGKRILEAQGLGKRFGEHTLFEKSNFYLRHGERIALIGPNGAGKTTFIRMLLDEEKITEGSLWKSPSIQVAYLSQDVNDLPLQQTALQYLDLYSLDQISRVRTILANMAMKEDKLTRPMAQLSLGERTRVKLVYMILQDYDVLILDEPTNHLDLPSREQLEETLSSYTGTLIIVSHDLYFIEKLCHTLFIIENKQMKRVEMGLREYQDKQKMNLQKERDLNAANKKDGHHTSLPDRKEVYSQKEELLAILDTKISELLGRISQHASGTEEYVRIDKELTTLMKKKREIKG